MSAARLAQHYATPKVARQLAHLLRERHRLVEIGQEVLERLTACHLIFSSRFL
jgi:hypothetical protein